MDSEKGSMKTEPVDMSGLTEEVVHLLTPAAEKRGQQLESRIEPESERIAAQEIAGFQLLCCDRRYRPYEG
jgi:hypothetical protein